MKQFGSRSPGTVYVARPSGHAVIFDASGRVLSVEYRGKLFLPGGGVEPGETSAEASHREALEETGFTIRILSKIGTAAEFVDIPDEGLYLNKLGDFFLCEITASSGTRAELDHRPIWLPIERFVEGAAHQSHVWAVTKAQRV